MSWNVDRIDRTTLPEALLPLAKSQSRVTATADDVYITELCAQALDDVERAANATFFDRTISGAWDVWVWCPWWRPPVGFTWNSADAFFLTLPFNNVRSFMATDANANDVSSSYSVTQTEVGGVAAAVLSGPMPAAPGAPVTFSFECGVLAVDDLVPSVRRAVLRRCAALYENREAPLDIAEADSVALWRPDV
jgi:hypothetical protein